MTFALRRALLEVAKPLESQYFTQKLGHHLSKSQRRNSTFIATVSPTAHKRSEELLVVVGGGAAGVYGAIRANTVAPNLSVLVVEKGKPLSKVKISGGGRCNVTNGHCTDKMILSEHYPRSHKELRGSFFDTHGPADTMAWFSDQGVELKTEGDGRVFPTSDSSASIIDCLMTEAKQRGVSIQTGKVVTTASPTVGGKFRIKIEKRTIDYVEDIEVDYLLIASGSSRQVGLCFSNSTRSFYCGSGAQLIHFQSPRSTASRVICGHISESVCKVKAENCPEADIATYTGWTHVVTHWGLSGPAVLRLSSWGARYLSSEGYEGTLLVDFLPDEHLEDVKSALIQQKKLFSKQKLANSCPPSFGIVKRFWKYVLDGEGVDGDILWASISNNSLMSVASLLKQCTFQVTGKGQFKDEFVTAGGVPLSEVALKTMESRKKPNLFFAGEGLNVDGVTGGFNFQNAWSGGYIAGTSIGRLAAAEIVLKNAEYIQRAESSA